MSTHGLTQKIEALLRTGHVDEAEAHLINLITTAPDLSVTWNMAAVIADKKNQIQQALEHLDKAIVLDPDFFEARYNQILILARDGRSVDVLAQMKFLEHHNRFNELFARRLIEKTAHLTDEVRRNALRLAVARATADFDLVARLALLLSKAGQKDEAIQYLHAANWPTSTKVLDDLPILDPGDLATLAWNALQANHPMHAAFLAMKAHGAGADVNTILPMLDDAVERVVQARVNPIQLLLNLWDRFPQMLFSAKIQKLVASVESSITSMGESAVAMGRLKEAVRLFGFLAAAKLPYGFLYLANTLEKQNQLVEAERVYRQLVDWPEESDAVFTACRDAGLLLIKQGRPSEARPLLERSLANREEPQTLKALGQALIAQGDVEGGSRLVQRADWLGNQTLSVRADAAFGDKITKLYVDEAIRPATPPQSRSQQTPAPWPVHAKDFEDYKRLATRYVLRNLPGPARCFGHDARVFTFGSCFAGNIARNLRKRDIRTYHADFFEDINTTFANRYLVEWLARGPIGRQSKAVELCYGQDARATVLNEMKQADIIVMTVGVAPSLFDAATGEVILAYGRSEVMLSKNNIMRTSRVEENVENLCALLDDIRMINETAEIFLTLSPIPLRGTVEMSSAVMADCVSKSVLRVAMHEIFSSHHKGVYYWPSFEIIRWLGSHLSLQVFEDDGRHVREEHLDMIMDFFYQRFFNTTLEAVETVSS
jgi:tetratricopeptide (TPR) repeat protein